MSLANRSRAKLANWPEAWPFAQGGAVERGAQGMVATTDRYASDVALAVLRSGGNAVDSSVAAAFALAVVNPEAGNLGGGGFLMIRRPDGGASALDFRTTAPIRAGPGIYDELWGDEVEGGRDGRVRLGGAVGGHEPAVPTSPSLVGHRAVAVPGSVRGLWEAHREYGTLPWQTLVQPAVGLARGFVVGERFLRSLTPPIQEALRLFPSTSSVFLPSGSAPLRGDILIQTDLADTLERIRDRGPDGFYMGKTARGIANEMRRGGGLVTEEDLAAYRAVWRDPVRVEYRGHTLLTMPPPSAGGVALAEVAYMLGERGLSDLSWHGTDHVHLLAEAWKRAFADRNHHLGDPDFTEISLDELTSKEYGRRRGSEIREDRATPAHEIEPGVPATSGGDHTTHVSIVGPEGDCASLTTTLNTWYGSKLVAAGTGVLLNGDMDDFTLARDRPNYFGLIQGGRNGIEAGKRMLSAMTPTIVLGPDGDLLMVLGSAGGPKITTAVFQVISNVLDFGLDLGTAVAAPRVHHQHLPDEILCEPAGLASEVVSALRARGHDVVAGKEVWGDVHAVAVGEHGMRIGCSDPRRGGAAVGF